MANELQIDASILDALELGDMVDVEEASGVPITAFSEGGTLPFKAVVALAWVIRRHDEPEFTYEAARKLKMSDLVPMFAPTTAAPLEPLNGKVRRGSSAKSSRTS